MMNLIRIDDDTDHDGKVLTGWKIGVRPRGNGQRWFSEQSVFDIVADCVRRLLSA